MKFSIIMPIDTNRVEQFCNTYKAYSELGDFEYEFIMPTRSYDKVKEYFDTHNIIDKVKLIPYTHDTGYNPSKALNLGVNNAQYENIIITSPEVMPKTNVLQQLSECPGQNVLCQVFDEDANKKISMSLVNSNFRSQHPGMYFLAMFQKKDIEAINGWDEAFMQGYAWEDDDFGHRWNRAKLPFVVRDDIQAIHQYHPRSETIPNGWTINRNTLNLNDADGIIKPVKGLRQ